MPAYRAAQSSSVIGDGNADLEVTITRSAKQEGTHHKLDARVMSQFHDDSLDAKTSYTLSHKSDMLDMVAFAGIQRRGLMYDGRGKSIGVDTVAGDTADSHGNNLYLKVGKDIGPQRFQASVNRFRLYGEGDYVEKTGNARLGIPTESEKGGYDEGVAPRNKIQSLNFDYSHDDLLGGSISLQVFHHDADVLYGPDAAVAAQDRNIKPVGTLIDQSQLIDKKLGGKLTYTNGHPVLEEHFDGYTTFDATLTWDSGDYGRFTFAMENLFDKQYITYYAQTQRYVAATADDQYFAGHGRTFSLGWTMEF